MSLVTVTITVGKGKGKVSPEGAVRVKKGDDLSIHATPDEHADNTAAGGAKGVAADSIAKLGILVATYRLRAQLRQVAQETGVRSRAELVSVLKPAWGEKGARKLPPGGGRLPRHRRALRRR